MAKKRARDATHSEAEGYITTKQHELAASNQLYVNGDHYQGGVGWIGPMLPDSDPMHNVATQAVSKNFVSRNAIREVCNRHTDGLLGREPAWALHTTRPLADDESVTGKEKSEVDEEEAAITEWWNDNSVHAKLQEATMNLLHQSRSVLKLTIPNGRLTESSGGGVVARARTLRGALRLIWLEVLHPKNAVVYEDPEAMEKVSIERRVDEDDKNVIVLGYVDEDVDEPEMSVTHIKTLDAANNVLQTADLRIAGRLLCHEMRRDIMVTKQVQENQRAMNLAVSMVPRTVVTAGFLEMIITGGQRPGQWVNDPSVAGGRRFEPAPFYRGPGVTNFIEPLMVTDFEGRPRLSNPDVHFRDPVSPRPAIEAKHSHYEDILHEVDQAHYLLVTSEYTSAVSRIEARMDYLNSLRRSKTPLETAGRWLIETVLILARAIVAATRNEQARNLRNVRADFKCRLRMGQLSPEEQQIIVDRWEKGLISTEDALVLFEVDDVDAMLEKINSQPGAMLGLRTRQAETYKAWIDAGAPEDFAAKMAGLSDDDIKLLSKPRDPMDGGAPTDPVPALPADNPPGE